MTHSPPPTRYPVANVQAKSEIDRARLPLPPATRYSPRSSMPSAAAIQHPGSARFPVTANIVQRAAPASKPPGGKYPSWEAYNESKGKWAKKHADRKNAAKPLGGFLFHCTKEANLTLIIAAGGLAPKQAAWGEGADASKDGILSMSITEKGAGAMGGKSVMLRVAWDDLAALNMEFKTVFGTEVRTMKMIPLAHLRRKTTIDGVTSWAALV